MRARRYIALAVLGPGLVLAPAACTQGAHGPSAPRRTMGSRQHAPGPGPGHRRHTSPPAPVRQAGDGVVARGVAIVMPERQVLQPGAPLRHPLPTHPLRTDRVTAPDGRRYLVKTWAREVTGECAPAGVGPARSFLRRHPCTRLVRLLGTSVAGGRQVGFAAQSVTFRSPRVAARLRPMIRRGPALIATLFSAGDGLPTGPQSVPGVQFLVADRGRTLTTIYYWYLDGGTPWQDPVLERFARDVYLGFAAGRR